MKYHVRPTTTALPLLIVFFSTVLSGCSTLPTSGPTGHQIIKGISQQENGLLPAVTDISPSNYLSLLSDPDGSALQPRLASLEEHVSTDVITPGDKLDVVIYEVGFTLFGSSASSIGSPNPSSNLATDSTSKQERMSDVVVDADGTIRLPYVGRLHVAGRTPDEAGRLIEHGLRGLSQSPQAMVTIINSTANAAYVSGDVRQSVRVPLGVTPVRLRQGLVLAGGSIAPSADSIVRVYRGARSLDERLSAIIPGSNDDLILSPGDQVEVIKAPRSYSLLGASGRVNQISFDAPTLTLAEAIARAGGPNDAQADPKSIFIFRSNNSAPKLFRINLMNAENYILAQNVYIKDKDTIYIANASANMPSKLISIVNQLFSPFVTTRAIIKN